MLKDSQRNRARQECPIDLKVIIVSTYPPLHDGIAWATHDIVQEISRLVNVIVLSNGGMKIEGKAAVYGTWKRDSILSFIRTAIICSNLNADIVHMHFHAALYGKIQNSIFFLAAIGFVKKPKVVELHSVKVPSKSRGVLERILARVFMMMAGHLFEGMVVHTHEMKSILVQEYNIPSSKVTVIPRGLRPQHPANTDEAKHTLGLDGKFLILNTSLLREGTGVEEMLESLEVLTKTTPNIIYAVLGITPSAYSLGQAYHRRIEALIRHRKIEENVRILDGSDVFDNLPIWIAASDLETFLNDDYPSEDSSFSILLDAVAYQKPVLVSSAQKFREIANILRSMGANDLVIDNLLPRGQKIAKINDALKHMMTGDKLKITIAAEFARFARTRTWRNTASSLLAFYNRIVNSERRAL